MAVSKNNNYNNAKLSSLPAGISPFEKSLAKSLDVQGSIRQLACRAVDRALAEERTLLELDFPAIIGGDLSKTQFDDLDSFTELDSNRDWCCQWLPHLVSTTTHVKKGGRDVWLVLPDDKECELAKNEWNGRRYRDAARFTSLRAACEACLATTTTSTETTSTGYTQAWGTTFASTFNKLTGGDGILGDSNALDPLDPSVPRLQVICQPGNGGPVEDWINVKVLHESSSSPSSQSCVTIVVNGALDKVRDGYYPPLFFPALAKTIPFYKSFEAALVLKPVVDKGVYGWLFRVYPEPWQVILQTARPVVKGGETTVKVQDFVALVSATRPTYTQAVQALLAANQKIVPK